LASRYDDLDASTEVEQRLTVDLTAAFGGRGCEVVHHGTNSGGRHSPGGKPDIELRDHPNKRLVLVEVTKRRSSSADGEFLAITDHLQRAIDAGGYDDYCVLYVSPSTSARMSMNLRDLWNRTRERDGLPGHIIAIDFDSTQMMLDKLAESDSTLYPSERLGVFFDRWAEAVDDARARLLIQRTLFPEDLGLAAELEEEVSDADAEREKRLKKQLESVENKLRSYGVTGNQANVVLIYLTFLRLYEERRQRSTGQPNRFTAAGFTLFKENAPASIRTRYGNRMFEALLHEVAEDEALKSSGLLRDASGKADSLNARITDAFVESEVLAVFDQYDFHSGRMDVLGAVFETLARRGEKDTRVGQFFTPQPVVDFAVDVVPMTPRDVVADPAVGTGRFLIRAMDVMLAQADDGFEARDAAEVAIRSQRLLGSDIDGWVATIAKMNMFIHGDGKTNIKAVNGLVLGDTACFPNHPDGLSQSLDVVLTNPPLGNTSYRVAAANWAEVSGVTSAPGHARIDFLRRLGVVPLRGVEEDKLIEAEANLAESHATIADLEALLPDPAASRRLVNARRTRDRRAARVHELAALVRGGNVTFEPAGESMKGGALFLGAIADYLRPVRDQNALLEWRGGWAAVVVDEAILNTPDYGPTREFIRDHFYVKAVVSLSRDAFKYLAHTDAKTSVIFLVRKPEAGKRQREPIFFAHADRVGYSRTGEWVGDDLPQVALLIHEVREAVFATYSGAHLDRDAVEAAVERVPGFGHAFYTLMDEGSGRGRLDFYYARYMQRRRELEEHHGPLSTLGDYLEISPRERPEPNRRGEYRFANVSRVTGTVEDKGVQRVSYPPTSLWVVHEGELVVSGIDAVHGSVAVAGADVAGAVMSDEMFAYKVRDDGVALPEYLQLLITSEAAREMLAGLTTGTSNRTRLEGPGELLGLPIPPLPPIEEQRALAEKVHSAQDRRREALRLLQEARTAGEEPWRYSTATRDAASTSVPTVVTAQQVG
jgi:type I restriction-modification system DNA methylase subunit